MSSHVRTLKFTTKFDGDDVVMELKPLRLEHLLTLGSRKRADKDDAAAVAAENADALKDFQRLWGEYCLSVSGLFDAGGNPIAKEVVGTDAYFGGLMSDAMVFLMDRATPADPKQPGAQPST
jgi:hypothetical protein